MDQEPPFPCLGTSPPHDQAVPDAAPTVHSEKDDILAFGHKRVKFGVFVTIFRQSPMECSSNCVFEVYFSKEQAITRIGFRPGFAAKALNWGKTMKIQAVHSTCITVHLRFEPQLRYLLGSFFKFRIWWHCTVHHKIAKYGSSPEPVLIFF